ncbi:MAG: helix-turn-helix domain-containing protein [Firmicutes bacterium]|nr:helix-turn-helix domain-containing protein [Bacillota bacterium]
MEELLTQEELCKWLKISNMTAYRWRKEGMPYIKRGNVVRYDKAKVKEWLERKNGHKN